MGLSEDERKAWERAWRSSEFQLGDDGRRHLLANPDLLKALGSGQLWGLLKRSFFRPEAPADKGGRMDAWKMLRRGQVELSLMDFPVVVDYKPDIPREYLNGRPTVIGIHDGTCDFDLSKVRKVAQGSAWTLTRRCKIARFGIPTSVKTIRDLCVLLELEEVDPRTLAAHGCAFSERFLKPGRTLSATGTVRRAAGGYAYVQLQGVTVARPPYIHYDSELMDDPDQPIFQQNDEVLLARPLVTP